MNERSAKRRRQQRLANAKGIGAAAGLVLVGFIAGGIVFAAEPETGESASDAPVSAPVIVEHIDVPEVVDPLAGMNKIENCTVTYYCAEEYNHICGWGLGITATGAACAPGEMVAVDPDIIPLHSLVYVDYGDGELHEYRAEDVGGAIKGNHIDVMMATHKEALAAGKTTATVYWMEV